MWSLFTCTDLPARLFLLLLLLLPLGAHAQLMESALMPGKVIEGHAKVEQECNKCHVRFNKAAQAGLCKECHKEVAQDIQLRIGYHGRLKELDCRTCHSDHRGRDAAIALFDKDTFNHAQTDFALRDKHKEAKCGSCHKGGKEKYRSASSECNSCHKKDDVHKGKLGEKCATCHGEKNWKGDGFDHERTKFPLAGGKHAEVKCKECHLDRGYKNAPRECHGCHRKDDQEKGHKGNYGAKCESCHNDKGWKELRFNHDSDTRYALRGKHRNAKCNTCHLADKGPIYQAKLPSKCVACHNKDDQDKGHRGGLGDKCESCHNEKGWKTASFDHDKDTKYPLRDKHKTAKCETCHKGGVAVTKTMLKLENDCVACHRKDDQEKGHKGRYGAKCEACHNEKGWQGSVFDHGRDTTYPLRDKHRQTKCDACHLPEKGPVYQKRKLETLCIACHKKDDKHRNQLGDKCESCHKEKEWKDAPYDHARARFQLSGMHVKSDCRKCHNSPAFRDAPSTCLACHEKEDVHKKRLGGKCETCHNARSWKSWDYNHDLNTQFKLDGGHKRIACVACHRGPVETKFTTPKLCGACHIKDDVHNRGLGVECERCHTSNNFRELKQ